MKLTEVSGYVGNFKVKIRQKPRYVDITKCTGCGTCQEKCPIKADNEFDVRHGQEKGNLYALPPGGAQCACHRRRNTAPIFLKGKCRACEKFCEAKAIDFEQKEKIVEVEVGNIIVTTGFESFRPVGDDAVRLRPLR